MNLTKTIVLFAILFSLLSVVAWESVAAGDLLLAPKGVQRIGTASETVLKKSGIKFPAAVEEVPISSLDRLHSVPRIGKPATHIPGMATEMQSSGFDLAHSIQVFRMPNGSLRVAGGHHRIAAMEIAGEAKIPAQILDWSKANPAGQAWFREMFPHLNWP